MLIGMYLFSGVSHFACVYDLLDDGFPSKAGGFVFCLLAWPLIPIGKILGFM